MSLLDRTHTSRDESARSARKDASRDAPSCPGGEARKARRITPSFMRGPSCLSAMCNPGSCCCSAKLLRALLTSTTWAGRMIDRTRLQERKHSRYTVRTTAVSAAIADEVRPFDVFFSVQCVYDLLCGWHLEEASHAFLKKEPHGLRHLASFVWARPPTQRRRLQAKTTQPGSTTTQHTHSASESTNRARVHAQGGTPRSGLHALDTRMEGGCETPARRARCAGNR